MKSLLKIVILSTLTLHGATKAQTTLSPYTPVVYHQEQIHFPFAGGINSAQYQTMDLDHDGDLDLIVFDRSSDKINCYENQQDHYTYHPEFEHLFPSGIQNWMILKDYNCDGRKDLFTSSQLGIHVYQNTSDDFSISWEEVANPLLTNINTNPINIFLNTTDIPSIEDLDGDGDIDILVFDFATGITIDFHENLSMDLNKTCDLIYTHASDNYGGLQVCDCDNYQFAGDCSAGGRLKHLAGKAILSIDQNQDGLMDLIISEEDCPELNYLANQGNSGMALFNSFSPDFPSENEPLDFTLFPASFYEDVTFDGQKDLLISPNVRDNSQRNINFQQSSLVYPNQGANSFTSSRAFLQQEMIDVGEWAYPSIADINGDGINDLVLGNKGSLLHDQYVSTLTIYLGQADGSFSFHNSDQFGLGSLGHTDIKPQFVDINGDHRLDLVFTSVDERFRNKMHYLLNLGSGEEMTFNLSQLTEITISYTSGDDVLLYDMDDDGILDALIARSYGELDYYRNTGEMNFVIETFNLLDAEKGAPTNLSITIGDLDSNGSNDLLTTDRSGQMTVYNDFPNQLGQPYSLQVQYEPNTSRHTTRLGRYTKPIIGQLFGKTVVAAGSIQGGLWLYQASSSDAPDLTLLAYPNPTGADRQATFRSNQDATLYLLTTAGHLVLKGVSLRAGQPQTLDFSTLRKGVYIAYIQSGNAKASQKIIVD
ncbi:T9SS type A sorting domain-containing protein [Reichenbachiella sp. MSK19-1]|uniref:T9SS type A sorting domain-containing protein n=1 Tax=Reichenbachiella sp. MSK19-1 TaxID=1897631 RepID=UPI000E6B9428|nr:T9SS type A sorting domain-containing protein [Reichenbachiella sp. MSK19-1]RJE71378.1 hypothetical protein BGP76_04580 [Reichenbachiella sp. MSK19-1]